MACIQPCLSILGINRGYCNGKEIWPRNKTEGNIASKLHNIHFYLIWKCEGVSCNKAVEQLGRNLK